MKKSRFILILGILFGINSCTNDLDDAVFIPDAENSNLPAYTEWGYNTFGAKYIENDGKQYFLSRGGMTPCNVKYDMNTGLAYFTLTGTDQSEKHWGNSGSKIKLIISFPSSKLANYGDLIAWNNMKLDLTDPACRISLNTSNSDYENITPEQGFLFFKRVQHLFIDEEDTEAILSGTFELKFVEGDDIVGFSEGRFDLGVGQWNFSLIK